MEKIRAQHYRMNSDQAKRKAKEKSRKTLSQISRPSTIFKTPKSNPVSILSSPITKDPKVKNFLRNSPRPLASHSAQASLTSSAASSRKTFSFSTKIDQIFRQTDEMIGKILEDRFEVVSKIADGGFSRVYKVFECSAQKFLAVKVSNREFKSKRAAQAEVQFLNLLKHQENICELVEDFVFQGTRCLVFPLYEMNLFTLLSKTAYEGLPVKLIKIIARQLLQALKSLDSLGLCHGDLKPENVFIESMETMKLRLGDFGCAFKGKIKKPGYMQSRFYRAPEVILNFECDSSIDIWSFGCLVSELYTGTPLFQGRDNSDQLAQIISILGPVPENYTKQATEDKLEVLKTTTQVKTLQSELRCTQEFSDFISSCLRYEDRVSADSALTHSWLN